MSKTRHTEQTLTAKGHTHIVPGTLYFCPGRNKQVVTIKTRGVDGSFDGNTREIATSDLHQTFWTVETKAELDALKRGVRSPRKAPVRKTKAQVLTPDHEVFVLMTDEEYEALQTA